MAFLEGLNSLFTHVPDSLFILPHHYWAQIITERRKQMLGAGWGLQMHYVSLHCVIKP